MPADLNVQITRDPGAALAKLTPRRLENAANATVSWGNNDSANIRHKVWEVDANGDPIVPALANSFRPGAASAPHYFVTRALRYASFQPVPSGQIPTVRISEFGEIVP